MATATCCRRQRCAIVCALLLCTCGVLAQTLPGSVTLAGDRNSLSLIAENVSLAEVVEYLAHQQGLAVESYSALSQTVDVTITDKPLAHVLRRLLGARSFTLLLDAEGGGRLWIWPCEADGELPSGTPQHFGRGVTGAVPDNSGSARGHAALPARDSRGGVPRDPTARADALSVLAEQRPEEAVALLRIAVTDSDPVIWRTALEELADIGSTEAVSCLGEQLMAADAKRRRDVVDLLADIDGLPATRLLEQAVADSDPGIRALANQYLAERRSESR